MMNSSTKGDTVTHPVSMTMDQWSYIDGCMDNEVAVESVDGDHRIAALAFSIREAGRRQFGNWTPDVPGSASWPPMEATVTPRLTAEQWRLETCHVSAPEIESAAAASQSGRALPSRWSP
jgi:hypothetical protein